MNGQAFRLVNEMVRGNAMRALQAAAIGGDEIMVVRIEPVEKKLTQRQNKLNRQEFNDYVENIRRWAANELQVFIPDPYAAGYEDIGRGR